MAIIIKTEDEINKMREAGKILAETHKLIEANIKPGISTIKLDQIVEDFIIENGAIPSFKDYPSPDGTSKFPGSICASINNEIIHGIPSEKTLKNGDIVSVDIGVYFKGYHADAARTYAVGEISEEAKRLIEVTKKSFFKGIKYAKDGMHLHKIGEEIQKYVEENGFSVVREFVGHGVGKNLHEDPQIPHYKVAGRGPELKEGMVIAVEPMVNTGSKDINFTSDEWTIVTKDGHYSAHYENTIVIKKGKAEILTKTGDEELYEE